MIRHGRAGRPPEVERPATQAGMSLVEVLVAVIIMGLVFTAVLSGIFTSVKITDDNSHKATADRLGRGLAEDIKSNAQGGAYPYITCAPPGAYSPYTPPAPYQSWRVEISKVEYWNLAESDKWEDACTGDRGLQRFTIEARPPVGDASQVVQTITVVKRDPKFDVGS